MSEVINNREYRQKILKELIMELHSGRSVEEVKGRFEKLIEGVSAKEISEMEAALIKEGMPVQEIQRLCDVHAAVFKGSIEEIHHPEQVAGHPIHTMKRENKAVEQLLQTIEKHLEAFQKNSKQGIKASGELLKLAEDFSLLYDLDKHYSRKENLIFPYLEKYGINAPPKVMWGVDDEIRAVIKETKAMLQQREVSRDSLIENIKSTIDRVREMIYKEENILFPMALDTLSEDEWLKIERESDEIGFCLIDDVSRWNPVRVSVEQSETEKIASENSEGYIKFETGILKAKEISLLLNTLPLDITFVDKDGVVKYFSQGKERIFARTKAIIGRKVQNCHPPASVHIVEKIVEDFQNGVKDHEDFWIKMGPNFVYIRYFAVRDENGEFMGTLEVTQNIKEIKELEGEKRLLSE